MQRMMGMDIHRTFAELVFWDAAGSGVDGRYDPFGA